MGPVHIISFSTEVYFYLEYGLELLRWQYEWLENDLKVIESDAADAADSFTHFQVQNKPV